MLRRLTYRFLLLLSLLTCVDLLGQTLDEYEVKAVFLYNFTTFVQWPAEALGKEKEPFVIGVLGSNVFGSRLQETIEGESVHGHPIVAREFNNIGSLTPCHILFIVRNSGLAYESHLNEIKTQAVLTVSDDPEFMQNGGIIYLYNENNKIRLQINADRASGAGLTISSKLLRLAKLYKER